MPPSPWAGRRDGRLCMDGHDLAGLAAAFGTPLHVASARTLADRAHAFRAAFAGYPAGASVHFSCKTNPVAALLRVVHAAGVGAEVVSGHELALARRVGVAAADIVFGGPNKSEEELRSAVREGVGLVVVEGLHEIDPLERAAAATGATVAIALRVCPDVRPRRMNVSTASGSRSGPFGMDAGELAAAVARARSSPHLRLRGAMAHIGSGIHDLGAFRSAVERLLDVQLALARAGADPDLLDVGGGLGAGGAREFTALEMLAYLGWGRLPRLRARDGEALLAAYAETLCGAIDQGCRRRGLALPRLVLEPGRWIASDSQALLLTVGAVRARAGGARFAFVDGGALSTTLMLLSERHEVVVANREAGGPRRPTSVFGRVPSAMDVLYRNLPLPDLRPGDVLAVMDAGAYFVPTATAFGGPRAAVVLVDERGPRLVRRRETLDDVLALEEPRAAETAGSPVLAGAR